MAVYVPAQPCLLCLLAAAICARVPSGICRSTEGTAGFAPFLVAFTSVPIAQAAARTPRRIRKRLIRRGALIAAAKRPDELRGWLAAEARDELQANNLARCWGSTMRCSGDDGAYTAARAAWLVEQFGGSA